MKRTRSRSLVALALGTCLTTSSCYGSFALTKKVHAWNGEVSPNKFVQWLVFLGLNVVPVYGVAVAADAIIFNTLEFWTGDNPIATAYRIETNSDRMATLHMGESKLPLRQVGPSTYEVVVQGRVVAMAEQNADRTLSLRDLEGNEQGRLLPAN